MFFKGLSFPRFPDVSLNIPIDFDHILKKKNVMK